jgi:hypothetical protein
MPSLVVVMIGFVVGLLTMTIVSLYKWVLNIWNND